MAPTTVDRLCFVLPVESGEFKPSKESPKPAMVEEETKKEEKKSRETRDCGRQVASLIGDLFKRIHGSKLVKSLNLNLCISESKDSVSMEVSKPFADMEGVQLSDKIGCENPRIFGYSELYIGSNGFSDDLILGSGGFGRVYKAVLPSDGTTVAVKCLADKKGEQFEKTFAAELVAVAQLRHRNLVKLRGWCLHDDELLLVYDYMPNRSLDRVLFRRSDINSDLKPLDWDRRGKIVKGLAAALFYLHEQLETQIIHRDVKTSNVMLDSEFNARLGDFGLARWLEHEIEFEPDSSYDSVSSFRNHQFRVADSTRIGGTIGYLPPESFRKKTVATAKTDVFSFGVVVLEIVSGRRAVDLSFSEDKIVLLDWVRKLSDDRRLLDSRDSRLPKGSYELSDMKRMIHLALLCSLNNPKLRPNMKWVIGVLSGEFPGNLPALPSFKSQPLYIPLSSLKSTSTSATTTTTTTTTTTNPTTSTTSLNASAESTPPSNYVTALEDSIYQTAETGGENRYFSNNSRRVMTSSKSFVLDTPREISYNDIVLATNNFSDARRVAEVDFGTAYYGLLNGDQHIVVKRLGMTKCPALVTRFSTELLNLGRLRHRNLVMLRGWCTEHGEMLVVYDYSANRMLSHLLFHNRIPGLRWKIRHNVIKSLACAVRYLHEEWDEQVVHRNITSSTIFLDRDMNPRLCGFALAEFLSRNDQAHQAAKKKGSAQGIFGYMAPEYMESGEATTMADVYSFGVVVLEMVTGQPAVDYKRKKEDALLVLKIRESVGNRKKPLEEIVDIHLEDEYERQEMANVLRLGLVCTRTDPRLRPSISQVVSILDGSERFFQEEGAKEGDVSRKQMYDSSMLMIRQMQALGIH